MDESTHIYFGRRATHRGTPVVIGPTFNNPVPRSRDSRGQPGEMWYHYVTIAPGNFASVGAAPFSEFTNIESSNA